MAEGRRSRITSAHAALPKPWGVALAMVTWASGESVGLKEEQHEGPENYDSARLLIETPLIISHSLYGSLPSTPNTNHSLPVSLPCTPPTQITSIRIMAKSSHASSGRQPSFASAHKVLESAWAPN